MLSASSKPESRLAIGVIGCGDVSSIYLENMERIFSLPIVACADIDHFRAAAAARGSDSRRAVSINDLLSDPKVHLVLNLTPPQAHAKVSRAILAHGKHVYSEKPLATDRDEGRKLLSLAAGTGLTIGCAPDTFLGGALQTCRSLIDSGAIGEPIAATAHMTCRGHESWHPAPDFFYQLGGGPLFDMGPYYLTALVALLGPIKRVTGAQRVTFPERIITAPARFGERLRVHVPTHTAALLEFASGPIVTLVTSFDVWHSDTPPIEIYGSEGTLTLPDPNGFGGQILLRSKSDSEAQEISPKHAWTANSRGLGAAELRAALICGRSPRASGELAFHILDVMQAVDESAREGRHIVIASSCERPLPLSLSGDL